MVEADLPDWAAARLGVPPSDMRPRLVAAAVLAARRVAMDIWLESPGEDLSERSPRPSTCWPRASPTAPEPNPATELATPA